LDLRFFWNFVFYLIRMLNLNQKKFPLNWNNIWINHMLVKKGRNINFSVIHMVYTEHHTIRNSFLTMVHVS
jgi:hypothetical protein